MRMRPVVFICLSVSACTSLHSIRPELPAREADSFLLQIEQSNQLLGAQDRTVRLTRAPFVLRITFPKKDMSDHSVFVNVSLQDRLFSASMTALDTESLGFGGTGMADYEDNRKRWLIVYDGGWNVMDCAEGAPLRFDACSVDGEVVTGTRAIEQLYLDREEVKISALEPPALYLVATLVRRNATPGDVVPEKTAALKLDFE